MATVGLNSVKTSYTYDEFQSALNESGLSSQFSDADLKLAQQNPDAGMSILNAKKKYASATTAEAKALANAEAEAVRSSYGGYAGGTDGSGYAKEDVSAGDFTYSDQPTYSSQYSDQISSKLSDQLNYADYSYSGTKPTYTDSYADQISTALEKQTNYGDFTYDQTRPEYVNRYDSQIQDALAKISENPDEFSYDPSTDDLYKYYRKQYLREGKRNTEDTLGTAAAASGGLASSYAVNAAAQAGNYYNAQLTDKIPELYQLAYNQYRDKISDQKDALSALQNQEQLDYAKWQAQSDIYDADKNFAYQEYLNKYNRLNTDVNTLQTLQNAEYGRYTDALNQYNTDRSFDYGVYTDKYNRISNDLSTLSSLEDQDYQKYRDSVSDYQWNKSFDYGQLLDEVEQQNTEKELAETQREYDQSYTLDQEQLDLQKKEYELAIKENDYDTAYKVAAALADAGDTSYLYSLKKLLQGS